MKLKNILLATLCIVFSQMAIAQKFKVIEGDLKNLNKATEYNIAYDYSDMTVGRKQSEADYIAKKKEDYNKKEAGKGDTWEQAWQADRTNRYQPKFEENYNNNGSQKVGNLPDATYTMTIHTTMTEPGYNVGVSRKSASINGEIVFTETANPSNVIARISFTNAAGHNFGGYDFDSGYRIQQAYEILGKKFAKYMKKY